MFSKYYIVKYMTSKSELQKGLMLRNICLQKNPKIQVAQREKKCKMYIQITNFKMSFFLNSYFVLHINACFGYSSAYLITF